MTADGQLSLQPAHLQGRERKPEISRRLTEPGLCCLVVDLVRRILKWSCHGPCVGSGISSGPDRQVRPVVVFQKASLSNEREALRVRRPALLTWVPI